MPKFNYAARCNELQAIFASYNLPNCRLIFREDISDGLARRHEDLSRIYIPKWLLDRNPIIGLHFLLHEIAHHRVGLKHKHNAIFEAEERKLHLEHNVILGPYKVRDKSNALAYAGVAWIKDRPQELIWLFKNSAPIDLTPWLT